MADYLPPRPIADTDDTHDFDCGRDALNTWLRQHARRNQASGATRTSVIRESRSGRIAGYVSLSAGQIERGQMHKRFQRNMPDPIPAVLLGQLAVDKRDQSRGLASALLYYAFKATVRIAEEIGCFMLLTHPLDDEVRTFYRKFDFADLPGEPHGAMYVRVIDMKKSGL